MDKVSLGKHKVTLVLADYEKYVQEVDVVAEPPPKVQVMVISG